MGASFFQLLQKGVVQLSQYPDIVQCMDGSTVPRIGTVEGLRLENGRKAIKVNLEVAKLSGGEELIIGMDLFKPLGYELLNVPFTWPNVEEVKEPKKEKPKTPDKYPPGVGEDGIAEEWRQVIADNQALPVNSVCQLPGAELEIDTGDAKPIWVRQYPIPQGLLAKVQARVQQWRDNGWIVDAPPDCKWNTPLLAAPKLSKEIGGIDDIRVCGDYRKLNELILNEVDSNLPKLNEIVHKLGTFEYISVLDLADSFQQFPIKKEHQEKTAFTCPERPQEMFVTVPYGLKIMTGHIQRLMEKLLGVTQTAPFVDDTAIASKTVEEHIKDVKEVLELITYKAKLRLRLKKCQFFKSEARVLGSIVSKEGIRMDPKKVKAVVEWPRPVDGKALQRFLGAANFHREFSKDFSRIAAPLEECRTCTGAIDWTPERITAFEAIKELFAKDILLRHIDWNKTMYLTTDASLIGVGAWLGQKDNAGDILPVYCISKKLTATQQRWSPTKRELWALMWAMNKLRYYLLGRFFIARVDHKPLVAMLKNKLNIMMEGWIDTIMEFNFTTMYVPGPENYFADALSRSYDYLITANDHKGDLSIRLVSLDINSTMLFEAEKRGKKIPSAEVKNELVAKVHAMGHFSVENMFRQLWNEGYWWPKMREDLAQVVRNCTACLRFDTTQAGYHPLKTILADYPWDHIEVDTIGPIPMSITGHCYILTIIDVMTGYTVLRAMKTKTMEEVATILWGVCCEYGPPKIIQSDNGTEFVNSLIKQLVTLYGIDHRLITAYHPSANGLVERQNKEVSSMLKKYMEGAFGMWEAWLPTIQLSLNIRFLKRTGSRPFELMYGRHFVGFEDYSKAIPLEDSMQALEHWLSEQKQLKEVILPGIADRNIKQRQEMIDSFNKNHKIVDSLATGMEVMLLDHTRAGKWDPVLEGPFTVVKQHPGEAYELQNALGASLPSKSTVNMLKPVGIQSKTMALPSGREDGIKEDKGRKEKNFLIKNNNQEKKNQGTLKKTEHYIVEKIIDHRKNKNGSISYLVKWKNWNEKYNSWVKTEDFDGLALINKYWKTKGKEIKN